MKILHLTLKKRWFDLIASGEKKFEYREDKPYWRKRLVDNGEGKVFDIVRFRNGYSKTAPIMDVEFKGISFTPDRWWTPKFGEEFTGNIIVISLGKVLA
uniref:ASCH domain-containing protein n=1 Tax=viral metagenome TaxID=1070528 RepID=A0A6M3LMG1_9ZZZZ